MKVRPLTAIDFYKADHRRQYPNKTEKVYSNWTPRSVKRAIKLPGVDDKVMWVGGQYFVEWFLLDVFKTEFFDKPKAEVVAYYKRRLDNSLGKDAVPMEHVEALHDLQYLPLKICALPEGTMVKAGVAMMTIENTIKDFFWLVNYFESILSNVVWKPCTSATTARKYRIIMERYAMETGAPREFVKFQGHDFSFRGMSGIQDAVMSGFGHLCSFVGTDTVPAIDFAEDYYGANSDLELVGCSVPATEHSVMCMGSRLGEFKTFKRLVTELYPKGIVSIVSDTWDFWQVLTDYLPRLKKEIMAREGKVVIRPDSGDPVKIVCGDPDAMPGTPEFKGAVEVLWDTFRGKNLQGRDQRYRFLDEHIGLIYGDSITPERCVKILAGLKAKGFGSANVVFGIGSYTYECTTRDVFGFAMKATWGQVDGVSQDIYKDPKTDTDKTKKSARGRLAVLEGADGELYMFDQVVGDIDGSYLQPIFVDGKQFNKTTLAEIRKRNEESIMATLTRLKFEDVKTPYDDLPQGRVVSAILAPTNTPMVETLAVE
jgi:nicotinamide phosphoribosyltransferase